MADFLISSFIIAENYRDMETLPVNATQMWLFQGSLMHYFCFQKGQVHVLQNAPVAKAHTVWLGALPPSPSSPSGLPGSAHQHHLLLNSLFLAKPMDEFGISWLSRARIRKQYPHHSICHSAKPVKTRFTFCLWRCRAKPGEDSGSVQCHTQCPWW